jgi:predicted AAA+ superfamily ATPase
VLDEFQLRPDLLPILRVLADRTPQTAQFLLLGSASPDLIRGASETLAGRIEFVDVAGLELDDVGSDALDSLWVRGAFPLAFLADNDHEGFVIEQILMKATGWQPWFWATHGGAELDLLLIRGNRRLGLECKYTETPRATRSMHVALRDLRLDEITVIYPGHHTFPLADKIIARPLPDAGERLAETQ